MKNSYILTSLLVTIFSAYGMEKQLQQDKIQFFNLLPKDILGIVQKLLEAARAGNLSLVQQLLAAGVNVNVQDTKGNTALMGAARHGHAQLVKMLIAAGANVNAQNTNGSTALMQAVYNGRTEREVIKILIAAAADINAQDKEGDTALMKAVARGHTEIVRMLIAANADVAVRNKLGNTALDLARTYSLNSSKEIIKLLKVDDARQLAQDKGLYFSMLPKDVLDIVEQYRVQEGLCGLLDRALELQPYSKFITYIQELAQLTEYAQFFNDPQFIDSIIYKISSKFGKNQEDVARDINIPGVGLWLIQIRPDQLKLLEAAGRRDLAEVQQLVGAGVNVNVQDTKGNTALMSAARHGHAQLVKMLIAAGANVNAQNTNGSTALMQAVYNGRTETEVIKILIAAAADINAQDEYGATALMNAVARGHTEIVRMLLAANADVAVRNKLGNTALDLARTYSFNGSKEIIKLLESVKK